MVRNILQQYARSTLFNRIYLISNSEVEKSIGDFTIEDYYEKLNEAIAYSVHMVNVFTNQDSVLSTLGEIHPTSRIATLGFFDLEKKEENLFFPLDFVRHLRYYFGVDEEIVKNDTSLLARIKDFIKSRKGADSSIDYEIHKTNVGTNVGVLIQYSTLIQEQ